MTIKDWDWNTVMTLIKDGVVAGCDIEHDNQGQIILYTGLYVTDSGELTDERPDDE